MDLPRNLLALNHQEGARLLDLGAYLGQCLQAHRRLGRFTELHSILAEALLKFFDPRERQAAILLNREPDLAL